ncbi:MAG: UbiA family prenyltransferase [Phaeodactylibacter sp.]|nr:UbiA family prenyltransferase [Phaeodactylibacter sp.]
MSFSMNLLRKADWFTTKVPMALGFYYLGLWALGPPLPGRAMYTAAAMVLAYLCSGIFVRFYNDLFDMAADARAGKFNLASKASPFWRVAAPLLATACIPLILLAVGAPLYLYALMGVQHLLYLAYSTPPIRLKNRALGGVLADAAYGHAMPAAIGWAFAAFATQEAVFSEAHRALAPAIFALQLLSGASNILKHQIEDHDGDTAAGIRTLVVALGAGRAWKLGLLVLAPLELAGVLVFLLYLAYIKQSAIPALLALLVLVHALLVYTSFRRKGKRESERLLLFQNEVFETWFPLSFLGLLISRQAGYLILLAGHLAIFFYATFQRFYHYAAKAVPLGWWIREKAIIFYYHRLLKQYARLRGIPDNGKASKSEK